MYLTSIRSQSPIFSFSKTLRNSSLHLGASGNGRISKI